MIDIIQYHKTLIASAILIAIASFFFYTQTTPSYGAGQNTATLGTIGGVACGSTSTLLIASSSARQYIAIVNDSANTVYLSFGQAAVGSNGVRLNASGGSLEMDSSSNYFFTGSIYCIASSSSQVAYQAGN